VELEFQGNDEVDEMGLANHDGQKLTMVKATAGATNDAATDLSRFAASLATALPARCPKQALAIPTARNHLKWTAGHVGDHQ
jgi:hypothetical protein